jgi:class 3 adenylate cyclase
MKVLREHNNIIREQLSAHGGFEVKSEGDGFMVAFQSARKALDCAIAIQKTLGEHNDRIGAPTGDEEGPGPEPIRVRIGLHSGEAIKEGDDFFGKNVILAARIAAQAKGGEVLVSGLLKALVESAGDINFGERREIELKGLPGTHEIWTARC